MANYAKVLDSKVTNVIVADQEFFKTFVDTEPKNGYKLLIINHGGVHSLGGTPLRKNYAGIGYSYDRTKDAFIPPKPYSSWILDEQNLPMEITNRYAQDFSIQNVIIDEARVRR